MLMRHLRTIIFLLALFVVFSQPISAQLGEMPRVKIITDNYDYMISQFPDDYPNRKAAIKACRTISDEADSIKLFWEEQGEIVLYYLSYYAGISWIETEFEINLVKYYPDYASHNPMTIPLTGKKNGNQIIALPQGLSHYLTLFQQLSKRLLEQTSLPGGTGYFISGHPLLRKTPRRFDNMANLLALNTIADFVNIDSVLAIFKSAHWRQREVGQEVLFGQFWDKWQLSGDSTLAFRIASEPYGSRLVSRTRPPAKPKPRRSGWGNHQLQAPPSGQLGLSIAKGRSGFYRVVEIDSLKLAFLSGLRLDDHIRNVEGQSPRNIKQFFSMVLAELDNGVHVNIVRNDEPEGIIIYPWSSLERFEDWNNSDENIIEQENDTLLDTGSGQ